MILCITSDCGSAYLRDIYGLILVCDIGMDCNLNSLIGHALVSNYCRSFQNGCVKFKDYLYTSAALFCRESCTCRNLLAVNQDGLSCCLIHKLSCNGIFLTNKNRRILHRIHNRCLRLCLGVIDLGNSVFCIGANLWQINCLILVRQISMNCNFLAFGVQSFKYNCDCILKSCSIKLKCYINTSFCLSWGKGCACSYVLTIYNNGLSGCAFHQSCL